MLPEAECALAVGRIASGPGATDERAVAVLDRMRVLLPYEAGGVILCDVRTGGLTTVADRGFDGDLRSASTGREARRDSRRIAASGRTVPVHLCGAGSGAGRLPGWQRILARAGYEEGVLVGLFTSDDHYLGFLGLLGSHGLRPAPATRSLLGRLAPSIADAVDPLRPLSAAAAELVEGCTAGVALSLDGRALRLPGLPTHPRLRTGSAVLLRAARQARQARQGTFLIAAPGKGRAVGYTRVTVLRCRPRPAYDLAAIVLLSPAGQLYGLTRRELEIIGLVVEGGTNQRIAAALRIAERTVAAHIEHILAKLAAVSRTQVAVRAVGQGLYLPSCAADPETDGAPGSGPLIEGRATSADGP